MSPKTVGITFAVLIAIGGIAQAITGGGLSSAQAASMFSTDTGRATTN